MPQQSYLLTFLLVVSAIECNEDNKVNCTKLRNIFADHNSQFTQCVVYFSRPIKLCENCVEDYLNLTESYHNMTIFSDDNGPCINTFINKDRLQTLDTMYDSSVAFWNKAKCYECFESENDSITRNKSKETVHFDELHQALMTCLNGSGINETTMCPGCMDAYTKLNDYYYSISNENEKIGVCMDIVDQMNTTRSFWSEKCCKFRQHSEYVFLSTTAISFIAAALFYALVKVCTDIKVATVLPQNRFAGSFNDRER